MDLFRRAIRLFLTLLGLVAGFTAGAALFFWRQMVHPPRQPLWANPMDAGLRYEDVEFPARDGLRLSGWFIPADRVPAATVILLHSWTGSRLGEDATSLLATISGALPIDLLRLAHALQRAGYNVFTFDLRNHGQSASSNAMTFGLQEANDLLGALDWLRQRGAIDSSRVGVVGFSLGANALLYALPQTPGVDAAVAVQPASPRLFARRYASDLLGPLGAAVLVVASALYRLSARVPLEAIEPVFAAAGAGDTPVLYVQGKGDRWGSVSNVAHMASQTPRAASPLFVDGNHRYAGYRYVVDHPEVVLDFFKAHLTPS